MSLIGRSLIKSGLAFAFGGLGLLGAVTRLRARTFGRAIHVLAYHRVFDRISEDVNPALCISTASFRRQMEQVRRSFDVLSLSQVVAAMRGEISLERDACAITFDDGYRDVLLRAHPILRDLRIPAALFVPTALSQNGGHLEHDRLYAALRKMRAKIFPNKEVDIDQLIRNFSADQLHEMADALEATVGTAQLDDGARVLSPDELATLSREGWDIGSHTTRHVALTHEPPDVVQYELAQSKRDIESWIARSCDFFAYCNGLHSAAIEHQLRVSGYRGAVTTHDRANHYGGDPMRIARKTIGEGHTRGPRGAWSESVSAAHLHDLFGALGLTAPVDGRMGEQT